jgi:uncharacterized membrane-anchored protein
MMDIAEHPQRQTLIDELHARPFFDFEGEGRFIRFIYLVGTSDTALIAHVNNWLDSQDRMPVDGAEKFRREDFGDFVFRLERHTEFVTIGLIVRDKNNRRTGLTRAAFSLPENSQLPFAMIAAMPTPLFHAIWLEIGKTPPKPVLPEEVAKMLGSRTAASNSISDGDGEVHCSFDSDEDGFSRMILFALTLSAERKGRQVLRLIELETYRMLALLGLPVVRDNMSRLHKIESQLAQVTQRMTAQINGANEAVEALLPELSSLAAEIEEMSANTSYRLSATKAYQDIFLARLERLNTRRLSGHQGLSGFLDRRMMPALKTCDAFEERLDGLSARISRAGSLLRTQTEIQIQEQNRNLLASMDRRAQAQLRLQQTVEGLSVIAGTYYGVGLVGYLVKLLPDSHLPADISILQAASVPVIAFLIWWVFYRMHRVVDRLNK